MPIYNNESASLPYPVFLTILCLVFITLAVSSSCLLGNCQHGRRGSLVTRTCHFCDAYNYIRETVQNVLQHWVYEEGHEPPRSHLGTPRSSLRDVSNLRNTERYKKLSAEFRDLQPSQHLMERRSSIQIVDQKFKEKSKPQSGKPLYQVIQKNTKGKVKELKPPKQVKEKKIKKENKKPNIDKKEFWPKMFKKRQDHSPDNKTNTGKSRFGPLRKKSPTSSEK